MVIFFRWQFQETHNKNPLIMLHGSKPNTYFGICHKWKSAHMCVVRKRSRLSTICPSVIIIVVLTDAICFVFLFLFFFSLCFVFVLFFSLMIELWCFNVLIFFGLFFFLQFKFLLLHKQFFQFCICCCRACEEKILKQFCVFNCFELFWASFGFVFDCWIYYK